MGDHFALFKTAIDIGTNRSRNFGGNWDMRQRTTEN